MIRVIVADDHTVLRDGLRYLLEAQGDIKIVGMAANGQEAVDQASLSCPDVILMDISMPVMNGIEATKHICRICSNTKVAILSMHHTAEYMQRALEAGAVAYLASSGLKFAFGRSRPAAGEGPDAFDHEDRSDGSRLILSSG